MNNELHQIRKYNKIGFVFEMINNIQFSVIWRIFMSKVEPLVGRTRRFQSSPAETFSGQFIKLHDRRVCISEAVNHECRLHGFILQ